MRRRTVRVGDRGGNCARREEKKEGGRGRLQIEGGVEGGGGRRLRQTPHNGGE